MLTENGSIRTKEIAVAPALDLYRKKLKLICLIMLIVGTVGLVAYIVTGMVWDIKWLDVLLVFAVPFTLGLIGFITFVRLNKREAREGYVSECEFFADCFICKARSAQGVEETEKIAYADAVLKRENEKYAYILVLGKGLFIVFGKEDLTAPELNAIRKNFRKEVAQEVEEVTPLEKFEDNRPEKE